MKFVTKNSLFWTTDQLRKWSLVNFSMLKRNGNWISRIYIIFSAIVLLSQHRIKLRKSNWFSSHAELVVLASNSRMKKIWKNLYFILFSGLMSHLPLTKWFIARSNSVNNSTDRAVHLRSYKKLFVSTKRPLTGHQFQFLTKILNCKDNFL